MHKMEMESGSQSKNYPLKVHKEKEDQIQKIKEAELREAGVLVEQREKEPVRAMAREIDIQPLRDRCEAQAGPKEALDGELKDKKVERRLKTIAKRKEMNQQHTKLQELHDSAETKTEEEKHQHTTELQRHEAKHNEGVKKMDVPRERKCEEEQFEEKPGERRKKAKGDKQEKDEKLNKMNACGEGVDSMKQNQTKGDDSTIVVEMTANSKAFGDMTPCLAGKERKERTTDKESHSSTDGNSSRVSTVKKATLESNDDIFFQVDKLLKELESESEVQPALSKTNGKDRTARKREENARVKNENLSGVEKYFKEMEEERQTAKLGLIRTDQKKVIERDNAMLAVVQSQNDDAQVQVSKMEKSRPNWLETGVEETRSKDTTLPLKTEASLFANALTQIKQGKQKASTQDNDFDIFWMNTDSEEADDQEENSTQEKVTEEEVHEEIKQMDLKRQDQTEKEKDEERNRMEERQEEEQMLQSAQRVLEGDNDVDEFLDQMDAKQEKREKMQEERRRKVEEANQIWSSCSLGSDSSCETETARPGRRQEKRGKKKVTFQINLSQTKWWLMDEDDV